MIFIIETARQLSVPNRKGFSPPNYMHSRENHMSRKIKITGTEDSFAESLQNCLGEMLVLFLLKQKPMYTYEIMQEINRISNGSFSYKSLYPYIYRLKNAGCIDEESTAVANNRTRIYFHITESGREHLVKIKRKYREITTAANLMLDLDDMIYTRRDE